MDNIMFYSHDIYNLYVLLWNILGIGAKYHFREVTNMVNFYVDIT